jgi:hypothetical protein
MSARLVRRIGLCLALAVAAGCGIKGDPVAPEPEVRSVDR